MVLGRSTSGAIKIKTDGGLRAVSCGCCGCQGMFKILGVDIQLPIATGSITDQSSWDPTQSVQEADGYLSYPPPVVGIFGNLSLQFVPIEFTPPSIPSDELFLRIYNPCDSGNTSGPYKAVSINMSLPTQIRVVTSSEFGWCEGYDEDGGLIIGGDVFFSGYIPRPYPCSPPTPQWYPEPPSGDIFAYESFQDNYTPIYTGYNTMVGNGILYVLFSNVNSSTDFFVDDNTSYAVNGVSLKNLTANVTYPATQSTFGTFGHLSWGPREGTAERIKFSGFNRTTPGDYELTWPLLKAPYRFTIPAP